MCGKNGLAAVCAHGCYCTVMKKMRRKLFSGQHRWLQIPTPVLPMMRKSKIRNLPNPMVSTASSTVNVLCSEHEKKIKTQKLSAVQLYLLFMKNISHATLGLPQEKAWEHLPVVCPLTNPGCPGGQAQQGVAETAASANGGRTALYTLKCF